MPSYFGQVCAGSTITPSTQNPCAVSTPAVDSGIESHPPHHHRESAVAPETSPPGYTVEDDEGLPDHSPPLLPHEKPIKPGPEDHSGAGEPDLPPTPLSSNSFSAQKELEETEDEKAPGDTGMGSIARALKTLVLSRNSRSSKDRRHASLPVSGVTTDPIVAAHIENPSSAAFAASPTSPKAPTFPTSDKLPVSKASPEHSKLTENAPAGLRDKNTPPLTPRALSHEREPSDKRSPTSAASSAASGEPTDASTENSKSTSIEAPRDGLPVESPKGKLSVRISQARGLRPSYDPYVVCVFEWNEYISKGPKHDATHEPEEKKRKNEPLAAVPIRRTDSDMGKPMAIPMKSRQSSNNSQMENVDQRGNQVTDPEWDHEAVL